MEVVNVTHSPLGIRHEDVLVTPRLPGRINVEDTARLIGFREHDIPVLTRKGLLKPLGKPGTTAPKWFASATIEQLRNDPKFLDNATKIVADEWRKRNSAKKREDKI